MYIRTVFSKKECVLYFLTFSNSVGSVVLKKNNNNDVYVKEYKSID